MGAYLCVGERRGTVPGERSQVLPLRERLLRLVGPTLTAIVVAISAAALALIAWLGYDGHPFLAIGLFIAFVGVELAYWFSPRAAEDCSWRARIGAFRRLSSRIS